MGEKLERLTENLFRIIFEDETEEHKNDPVYWFRKNKDNLDKSFYVVSEFYKESYSIYKTFKIEKYCKNKYYLWDEERKLEIAGETLNSFSVMDKQYTKAVGETWKDMKEKYEDRKHKYPFAYLCFHLMTTIGNLMPCIKGFNYTSGSGLDIVQDKVAGYIWILYGEKESEEINDFIKNHYLQDFIEIKNKKVMAIRFIEKNKDGDYDPEVWNLFFYRTAKAIMKRSYRILKEIDGDFSPEQKKEFNDAFIKFSGEFGINI